MPIVAVCELAGKTGGSFDGWKAFSTLLVQKHATRHRSRSPGGRALNSKQNLATIALRTKMSADTSGGEDVQESCFWA
jgi:hypothetical protein